MLTIISTLITKKEPGCVEGWRRQVQYLPSTFLFPSPQNCISQEALRSAQESVENPIAPAYPDVATASWLLGTATGVGGERRKCSCWCCW